MSIKHIDGYVNIFGAAVKLAVYEYQKNRYWKKLKEETKNQKMYKKEKERLFKSAQAYLFGKYGLERQIKDIGINLDIEYVRRKANEKFNPDNQKRTYGRRTSESING